MLLGEEHMGIVQQNQNFVQTECFGSYVMECESAKCQSAVAELEMHPQRGQEAQSTLQSPWPRGRLWEMVP